MKIYSYKTNQKFCCSIKKVKDYFSKTDIHISFGFLTKQYSTPIPDRNHYFCKNNIKGQVIASLQMVNGMSSPILSFYAIKPKYGEYEYVKTEFENNVLPIIYSFYLAHLLEKKDHLQYILLVDLCDNVLKVKTGTLN